MEAKNPVNAQPLIDMFTGIMDYLGLIHVNTILAKGVFERGAINGCPEIMTSASDAGQMMIRVTQ